MCDVYNDFLKRMAFTKKELLDLVNSLPDDVVLQADGPDSGGYDICSKNYVGITYIPEHNTCYFSHFEADAYEAFKKGDITREQCEEF